ncbi:MAG TPA: D-alanyl-D-alanine endopeptidase [Verrucomicrobiae bacterium]|nr:D-alanyl-D-alanine endopeptidase [Verrucomicrobiae bacterium]
MFRLTAAIALATSICVPGTLLAVQADTSVAETPAGATHIPALAAKPTFERLALKSRSFLVIDQDSGELIAAKNADAVLPVASLTKIMTALVVLDAKQPLDEMLVITADDVDREKRTPSRLRVGARLSRDDLMILSLMASENRAATALSRNYPGGRAAFIAKMNEKARALGMKSTRFADAAGLSRNSVSSARDLHLLLTEAATHPLINAYSTRQQHTVRVGRQRLKFGSSNRLVRHSSWNIEMQKTGYTNEAGRCLLMQARVANRRLAMVFLDSVGKLTRYGDAARVRRQVELGDIKKVRAKAKG